jgi:hypothetical protein
VLHSSKDIELGNQFVCSIVLKMLNLVRSYTSEDVEHSNQFVFHSCEDDELGNQFVCSIILKMLNLVISLCAPLF